MPRLIDLISTHRALLTPTPNTSRPFTFIRDNWDIRIYSESGNQWGEELSGRWPFDGLEFTPKPGDKFYFAPICPFPGDCGACHIEICLSVHRNPHTGNLISVVRLIDLTSDHPDAHDPELRRELYGD